MSSVISADELIKIITDENLILVDAGSGDDAYDAFLEKHLPNAQYVDLNKDLAEIPADAKFGGRHPLPSLKKFAELLENLGITSHSRVVIYDNKFSTNAAPRFWWMLKSVGFETVQVLDGGLQIAEKSGLKITNTLKKSKNSAQKFDFTQWNWPQVSIDFVEKNAQKPDFRIIDVRSKERFNGENEPIDLIAGHIQGAINLPFTEDRNEDGTLKPREVIKEKYRRIFDNISAENITIHCGSGVTACNTILTLDYAGFQIPNLYVGSWSEWSRNNKKISTNY